MIIAARQPEIGFGLRELFASFDVGAVPGLAAGRLLIRIIPWVGEDRLAKGTLT
jgi:hypothetical protein